MLTLNTLLKELRNVPLSKLEDLYSIIHGLRANTKKNSNTSKEILSFAGAFSDMGESDYNDFLKQTREARNKLFDRHSDL